MGRLLSGSRWFGTQGKETPICCCPKAESSSQVTGSRLGVKVFSRHQMPSRRTCSSLRQQRNGAGHMFTWPIDMGVLNPVFTRPTRGGAKSWPGAEVWVDTRKMWRSCSPLRYLTRACRCYGIRKLTCINMQTTKKTTHLLISWLHTVTLIWELCYCLVFGA